MQQWEDELRKFAPSLRVHKFYASSTNKEKALKGLRTCDVLLTTPHMLGTMKGVPKRMLRHMEVHRVVLDESHLVGAGGRGGAFRERLRQVQTEAHAAP